MLPEPYVSVNRQMCELNTSLVALQACYRPVQLVVQLQNVDIYICKLVNRDGPPAIASHAITLIPPGAPLQQQGQCVMYKAAVRSVMSAHDTRTVDTPGEIQSTFRDRPLAPFCRISLPVSAGSAPSPTKMPFSLFANILQP